MIVNGQAHRTIWQHPSKEATTCIIDQRQLPHEWIVAELTSVEAHARAIREMWVRGAPLIGATAAYGMYHACLEARGNKDPEAYIEQRAQQLLATRPTAVNLAWAVDRVLTSIKAVKDLSQKSATALATANSIADEDVEICRRIGEHGLPLLKKISESKKGGPINILTHCNAGWLACVDWGTATSPIYQAHEQGLDIHVWVDETRPRNQGARITAWELAQHGIPHTVIADNVGGHLMQHGMVDLVIVGTDRTTRSGDVANKIGTYLKALAAWDNQIPFYVALPSTTIDWHIRDGIKEIPIEQRDAEEVTHIRGLNVDRQEIISVRLTPASSSAANYGFDVTPAKYVTGLITERGVCAANEEGLAQLFPEKSKIGQASDS
ncbi:MAG: S-methyl-5-thioribose-1-phosphate isomerase [Bacteroidota bacterium]